MKIYLDNCCYNRPFDDQQSMKIFLETQAKLHIQQKIKDGQYLLVWSYVLEYENGKNPYELRKTAILPWKDIAVENIYENEKIISFAEKLAEKGIKKFDALHLSCAVYSKCDFFLTTDKKLLNTPMSEIRVVNPINFVSEMEE